MFFMAPGLVFMIPGGFSSSLMVPSWSISEPQLGLNPQARSETLRTLHLYLSPTIQLGLAGFGFGLVMMMMMMTMMREEEAHLSLHGSSLSSSRH